MKKSYKIKNCIPNRSVYCIEGAMWDKGLKKNCKKNKNKTTTFFLTAKVI